MNDQDRLREVMSKLESLEGLGERQYRDWVTLLDKQSGSEGTDAEGRLEIAVFDAKKYDVDSFQRENDDRFGLHFVESSLSEETVGAAAGFKAICVFVNDRCGAEVVKELADLGVELILLRCAGFNNVDLEACAERNISVVRVPAYSPHAVAEHTVALMLMLNRHLHQAYVRNRTGYFVLEGLTGFDMRGQTVGVIGTGKIGRCVIEILLGFGCHVLCQDASPNEELQNRTGVEYVELDRLLSESRIVTLHVPLLEETYHLIDEESIAKMKPGAMLINTSRGGLVDASALIHGLKTGQIGAAGLDVYEEEAGVFFHDVSDRVLTDDVLARLMTFNNVVITSHMAFLTHEALTNIAETTFANVEEYLSGKRGEELTNAVLPPE